MELSASQFCQRYHVGRDGQLQRYPNPDKVIVLKLLALPSTRGGPRYGEYCMSNLTVHRPWKGIVDDAFRGVADVQLDPADDDNTLSEDHRRVVVVWKWYLRERNASGGKPEVQFGERLSERLSETRWQQEDGNDDDGLFCDEPAEWMDAAGMDGNAGRRSGDGATPDMTWDNDYDCDAFRLAEDPQNFSSAPSFVAEKRSQSGGAALDGAGIPVVFPGQLNERQRQAFDIVKKNGDADDGDDLRMPVLGTAGTGKSWLVYTLSKLLSDHIRQAALTGMAAFLIGRSTLHSLLCLPVRGGKDLQGDSLKNYKRGWQASNTSSSTSCPWLVRCR